MNDPLTKYSILLVDDDASFLRQAKDFLNVYAENLEIYTAFNGKQALKILAVSDIDLVVTDLQMPEMDGFELLTHISKNHQNVSVIILTGFGTPEIKKRLNQIGHYQYLEKPLEFHELAEKILQIIKERSKTYVRGFTLAHFLQLVELEQKTCTLQVRSKERNGYLYLEKGELINAECNGIEGEEAAKQIIGWEDPETEIQGICEKQREIHTPLMHILLQATQLEDEKAASLDGGDLLLEAIHLAEGNHNREAKQTLTGLLKKDPRNYRGWLWYSRIAEQMKTIEMSLSNAAKLAPEDTEVVEEIHKFKQAKSKIGNGHFLRCPFCWFPLEGGAFQCDYCKAHLFIHKQLLKSPRGGNKKILGDAVKRYLRVITKEKNTKAHYYLGIAQLNLENWEDALGQLDKTVKLSPQKQFYLDQLQILLNHMASTGAASAQGLLSQDPVSDATSISPEEAHRKKILVVEDSSTTRKVIAITLNQNGFEIVEARDGLEALSRLNEIKPDLILLDIILPKMDGYKILSIIKGNPDFKDIPVIMLTSKDGIFNKVKGKVAGSTAYLTKPFDPKQLVETIERHLY